MVDSSLVPEQLGAVVVAGIVDSLSSEPVMFVFVQY